MKIEMSVGERGQVVIPKAIRDEMGIGPATKVVFAVKNGVLMMKPKKDMEKYRATLEKWRGAGRKKFLADGYTTVDEYIEDMRGR